MNENERTLAKGFSVYSCAVALSIAIYFLSFFLPVLGESMPGYKVFVTTLACCLGFASDPGVVVIFVCWLANPVFWAGALFACGGCPRAAASGG